MKKYLITILAILHFALNAQSIRLDRGGSIHKEIKLNFNDIAVKDNEYVIFEINDDFDFQNLVIKINGEPIEESTFKVYAKQENVDVNIDIETKAKAKGGDYNFWVKLKETSNNLKESVEYKGKEELKIEDITIPKTKQQQMTTYAIYGIILLAVLAALFFFYKKSRKFTKGYLQFEHPFSDEVSLRGKSKYEFTSPDENILVFELTKGKDGMPKIRNKISNELEVNGDFKSNGYQILKDDRVNVTKDGVSYAKFLYY